jgi:putative ABC transport system permease protein
LFRISNFGFRISDFVMSFSRTWHLIRLSWYSLIAHWLRSLLTILSIVLGVASVIVMLAVGEAARLHAVQQIEELGATNIIVRSVKPTDEGKQNANADDFSYGVTNDDLLRIQSTIPTIRSATPLREFRKDVRYLDRKLEARVVSVLPEYEAMNGIKLAKGRFITPLDNERYENFCVLGAETADTLFPVEDPIGRTVRIDDTQYFRVVGVAEKKASSAGVGSSLNATDYNRDVYIPFATDRVRFGPVLTYYKAGTFKRERLEISQLTIVVDRMENVKKTAEVIQGTLEQYHTQKDTELTVPLDLLERAEKTQRLFTQVLAAIGSISLIVGGIGIMNIMLATVTERTREIGIRRALGAKRRHIAMQFLFETLSLTSLGGFFGIGAGIGLSYFVRWYFEFPTIIRLWSTLLAFGVSVVVGLVFGIYPAMRAARMDPIEALRHE